VAEKVEKKRAWLEPTELGCKVIDVLTGKFAFAELSYTRDVEGSLDLVAEGKGFYKAVVAGVDNLLTLELGKMDAGNIGESHPCDCGGQMRRKKGPSGFFWGCSSYPECKNTLPDEKGAPGQRRPPAAATTGPAHNCPKCNKTLRKLTAKKGTNAGNQFWACSGYPDCKFSADDKDGAPVFKGAVNA
jgi:DNA topoisomerase I